MLLHKLKIKIGYWHFFFKQSDYTFFLNLNNPKIVSVWKIYFNWRKAFFFSPAFYDDPRKAVELQEKHDKLPHWCVKTTPWHGGAYAPTKPTIGKKKQKKHWNKTTKEPLWALTGASVYSRAQCQWATQHLKKHILATEGAGISCVSPSQTLKFLSLMQQRRRKKKWKNKQLVWNRFVHSDRCVLNRPTIKSCSKTTTSKKKKL